MVILSTPCSRALIPWMEKWTQLIPCSIRQIFRQVGGSQGPIFVLVASVGLTCIVVYRTSRRVYRSLVPPKHLRHLPHLGMSKMLTMLLSRMGYLDMHHQARTYLIQDAMRKKIDPTQQPLDTSARWLYVSFVPFLVIRKRFLKQE